MCDPLKELENFVGGVGDAVSGIGDAVSDVLGSVADTVTNTIEKAMEDPIGTIASVAAVATGNAWALPLISGTNTLVHGGSLEDALLNAGTAYVAGQVGAVADGVVGGVVRADAIMNGEMAFEAADTLGKIAGSVAKTAVRGGDPLQALISGGIGAGVSELTSQIPGFSELPNMVQSFVKNTISQELLGSPTQASVDRALTAGQSAASRYQQPTTGALPVEQNTAFEDTNLATGIPTLTGGLATVGKAGYEAPTAGLQQMYPTLTDANDASTANEPFNFSPLIQQNISPLQSPNVLLANNGYTQNYSGGSSVKPNDEEKMEAVSQTRNVKESNDEVDSALKELANPVNPFTDSPLASLMRNGQMGQAYAPRVISRLVDVLRSRGINVPLAEGGQPSDYSGGPPGDHQHPKYDGTPVFRTGGLEGLGGKYVEGKGDGTSDDISAMLANGEYVFSADVVAALGNGSNKAGADKLGIMVKAIRERARSAPSNKLPPDAKSPLEYLKSSKGKKHG